MLDRSLTEFLESGLAIHIGTRNQRLEPNGCRVTALRVEDQGTHLIAYLPKAATPAVLEDLQGNGQAAISVARPVDDRAVQVKGVFVSQRDADDAEREFVMAQWQGIVNQLDMIGFNASTTTLSWSMWPCVAVKLRVTNVFRQTPGPDAGAVLA
jgi:hypothetical protein